MHICIYVFHRENGHPAKVCRGRPRAVGGNKKERAKAAAAERRKERAER